MTSSDAVDSFARRLVAQMPETIIFAGGPLRGTRQTAERSRQNYPLDYVIETHEGYRYTVTEERVTAVKDGAVLRVARPTEHLKCGFLNGGLIENFVCQKGHAL